MNKRLLWIPVLLAALLTTLGALLLDGEDPTTEYRRATVDRGTVEQVVSATGTLQATRTVDVGTQVSGKIAEILVDYNDRVVEGQLLARIDPAILSNEVRSAEAGVERARAELEQARQALGRSRALHDQQVITDSEFEQAEYAQVVASSSYTSAAVALERARRNLEYTEIRAPIGGVVVERAVDVGQTVAASMSAPTLFRIAEDLSQMEILAQVDESDVASVREGQEVRFQVQATGEESFTGTVRQVRLQSASAENVVSYTVVIGVENREQKLLPGMTASVDFLVASAAEVLRVPSAALRIRPTEAMQASAGSAAGAGEGTGTLWTTDGTGRFRTLTVHTGLTDGQFTEISGAGLAEGTEVIAGVVSVSAATPAATTNPFQGQAQARGPGGF
jgi:HlyD family secretion protein